jgi:DNA mismatch repair protein MSH5
MSGIHEEERDEDLDALNEIVMAIDSRDYGTIGCAYYHARDETLLLMEDAKWGGKEMIDLRRSMKPQFITTTH